MPGASRSRLYRVRLVFLGLEAATDDLLAASLRHEDPLIRCPVLLATAAATVLGVMTIVHALLGDAVALLVAFPGGLGFGLAGCSREPQGQNASQRQSKCLAVA